MNEETNKWLNTLSVKFKTEYINSFNTPLRLYIKGKSFLLQGDETPKEIKLAFYDKYGIRI